jgi:hypothetical protein
MATAREAASDTALGLGEPFRDRHLGVRSDQGEGGARTLAEGLAPSLARNQVGANLADVSTKS